MLEPSSVPKCCEEALYHMSFLDTTMQELFGDWKRKLGIALLLLACVFAGGWIRGLYYLEFVAWSGRMWGYSQLLLGSSDEGIELRVIKPQNRQLDASIWLRIDSTIVESIAHVKNQRTPRPERYRDDPPSFHWGFCGFMIDATSFSSDRLCNLVVPYWAIVCPLTIASACLLIYKPRHQKLREIHRE